MCLVSKSVRVREARDSLLKYKSQLTLQVRKSIDTINFQLLQSEHYFKLVDKSVDLTAGLTLAKLPGGSLYYPAIRGVSDFALGAKTPTALLSDMAISKSIGVAGKQVLGVTHLDDVYDYSKIEYEYEHDTITFYQTRAR